MPHVSTRLAAAAALCAGLFAAVPVSALILHPADDPPTLLSKPADAVVGQWLGVNQASLVVVAPNFAVTTKHQGGGIGTQVLIDGTTYKVANIVNHPTADLRVLELQTLANTPANLASYVDVYDQTDEVGQTAVLGGYGEVRGSAIANGYNWAGDASRTLTWGANIIDNAGTGGTSDVLLADFDNDAAGVYGETTLAEGDSGGGWFLWTGSTWEVAALNRAVENNNKAIYSPPELFDGVRLSSYASFVNSNITVPEPTSAALLFGMFAGISLRRRRRD